MLNVVEVVTTGEVETWVDDAPKDEGDEERERYEGITEAVEEDITGFFLEPCG